MQQVLCVYFFSKAEALCSTSVFFCSSMRKEALNDECGCFVRKQRSLLGSGPARGFARKTGGDGGTGEGGLLLNTGLCFIGPRAVYRFLFGVRVCYVRVVRCASFENGSRAVAAMELSHNIEYMSFGVSIGGESAIAAG